VLLSELGSLLGKNLNPVIVPAKVVAGNDRILNSIDVDSGAAVRASGSGVVSHGCDHIAKNNDPDASRVSRERVVVDHYRSDRPLSENAHGVIRADSVVLNRHVRRDGIRIDPNANTIGARTGS
jgi:hypothetical protein